MSSTMAARPCVIEAGEDVLHPAPVGLAAGKARALGEAVELVGVVVLLLELSLVPHGIGDDAVEGLEAVALAELRIAEGVADLDLALHVVDDHVHVRHGPGAGLVFLAVELERARSRLPRRRLIFSVERQLALDEQAGRAAAWDRRRPCPARGSMMRAMIMPTSRGRVELAGALAAALGELADQVLVAAPDDVRLDVVEPQALGADRLDEVAEAVVVDVALAVGGGVEVDAVDDALEQRVGVGDGAEMGRELLADLVRRACG